MATRLTYTSGTRTPELDAAFERSLDTARADAHDALPHVVGGSERTDGAEFVREDPSRAGEIASRAREAPGALVHEAVAVAADAQRDWRALAVAERCARLRAAADVIRERVLEMAAVVTLETGSRESSRSPRSRRPLTSSRPTARRSSSTTGSRCRSARCRPASATAACCARSAYSA